MIVYFTFLNFILMKCVFVYSSFYFFLPVLYGEGYYQFTYTIYNKLKFSTKIKIHLFFNKIE